MPRVLRNPAVERWLPGGLSDRLLHAADPVVGTGSVWLALVMFAGVAVVLAGAALVDTETTDVN